MRKYRFIAAANTFLYIMRYNDSHYCLIVTQVRTLIFYPSSNFIKTSFDFKFCFNFRRRHGRICWRRSVCSFTKRSTPPMESKREEPILPRRSENSLIMVVIPWRKVGQFLLSCEYNCCNLLWQTALISSKSFEHQSLNIDYFFFG